MRLCRPWTMTEIGTVIQLLETKTPHPKIAAEIGRSVSAVTAMVFRSDLPRNYKMTQQREVEQIRSLAAQGKSDKEIARILGRSTWEMVRGIRQRNNIPAGRWAKSLKRAA